LAKKIVENILLNGGFGVNIMTNELKLKLGLQLAKPKPYHLRMANQTTTKLLGFIKNFKIAIDGTPYILTFTIMNNLLDASYSMLLGKPSLRNAKISHE
jgi:hypothetical protein